ncbi:unnamed protein product [Rotaria sp. Silwood2]|nr:unnamed protein product [Rotaria sp. Silwood2]CAF4179638.1 unnamed protein product [Rotaria sp. Silwood2]
MSISDSFKCVWFDPYIDIQDDLKESLSSHYSGMRFFTDPFVCTIYIRSIVPSQLRVRLVIKLDYSKSAHQLLTLVHPLNKIDQILLLHNKDQAIEAARLQQLHKLITVTSDDFEHILEYIRSPRDKYRRLIEIDLTCAVRERQAVYLTIHDPDRFWWFQVFKHHIIQMSYTANAASRLAAKLDMLEVCREVYANNSRQLQAIDKFEATYEASQAVEWYTKDTFVYRLINHTLRTNDVIDTLYTFRSYIADLCRLLADYQNQKRQKLTVFRGVSMPREQMLTLNGQVGRLVVANGFLSTTHDRQIAQIFAGESSDHVSSVVFEIKIDDKEEEMPVLVDTWRWSQFPDEQEVLFDLATTFRVTSIDNDGFVVKLLAQRPFVRVDSAFGLISDDIDSSGLDEFVFGKLLADKGEYNKSLRYFLALLERSSEAADQYCARIHMHIGRAYRLQSDYQSAFKHYCIAYGLQTNSTLPAHARILACTLDNMGAVHYDACQALEYHKRALALRHTVCDKDDRCIAACFSYIGHVYFKQGHYRQAIKYYQKDLCMTRHLALENDLDVARTYMNLANVFYAQHHYGKAMQYYEYAARIYQQCALPNTHRLLAEWRTAVIRCPKKIIRHRSVINKWLRDKRRQ